MARVSIPYWFLAVGTERHIQIQALFAEVIAGSPIPGAELAELFEVKPTTVWRWANGKNTPSLDTMQQAVEEVRNRLEQLLQRASVAQEALQHVVAAEEAYEATGLGGAHADEVAALQTLLDGLEG